MAPGTAASCGRSAAMMASSALRRIVRSIEGLHPDDKEGLVGGGDIVDEVEADHRQHVLHARDRADDVLDLRDDRLGAVERGTLGQPHGGEEGALVLGGQKALRRRLEHAERTPPPTTATATDAQDRHADQAADDRHIAVARRGRCAPST